MLNDDFFSLLVSFKVVLADEDETDPEVQFLKSLTPKQKKKLLK